MGNNIFKNDAVKTIFKMGFRLGFVEGAKFTSENISSLIIDANERDNNNVAKNLDIFSKQKCDEALNKAMTLFEKKTKTQEEKTNVK